MAPCAPAAPTNPIRRTAILTRRRTRAPPSPLEPPQPTEPARQPARRLALLSVRIYFALSQCEIVYSYVGDIVISVNPFKNVGNVGKAIRAKYKGASRASVPPHIYALVDHAYNEMMRNASSQSVRSSRAHLGRISAISWRYLGRCSSRGSRALARRRL